MCTWLEVMSILLWASIAWADTVVYYRSADGVVVGSTTSPGTVNIEQELPNWDAGVVALRVEKDLKPLAGKRRIVVNNMLTVVDDPTYVAPLNPDTELESAITSATTLEELKSALLGKTKAGKIVGKKP